MPLDTLPVKVSASVLDSLRSCASMPVAWTGSPVDPPAWFDSRLPAGGFAMPVGLRPAVSSCGLGKSVKKSESVSDKAIRQGKRLAFRRRKTACKVLSGCPDGHAGKGVCKCGQFAVPGRKVEVMKFDASASIGNLITCKLRYACAVCSFRICEENRVALNAALSEARRRGYSACLMTLTFRHSLGMPLRWLVDSMRSARKRLFESGEFKAFRQSGLAENAYAYGFECTYGLNGFHPHLHCLFILRDASAMSEVEALRPVWRKACAAVGLDASASPAFDVRGADNAGEYVSKFGICDELLFSDWKRARRGNLSPMQILDLLGDRYLPDIERKRLTAVWLEFVSAFKGVHQFQRSEGWKRLEDDSEFQTELELEVPELVCIIDRETWRDSGRFRELMIREVVASASDVVEASRLVQVVLHGSITDADLLRWSHDPPMFEESA